jgi:hypothetical protein
MVPAGTPLSWEINGLEVGQGDGGFGRLKGRAMAFPKMFSQAYKCVAVVTNIRSLLVCQVMVVWFVVSGGPVACCQMPA